MRRPIYTESYDGLAIQEFEEYELSKPSFLVLGLPDTGLVGPIAASHLVRTLEMKEVGGIDSDRFFPPMVVVHKGEPRLPVRLFAHDNMLVMVSETAMSPAAIYPLSYALVDYASKRGIDHIVSLLGMAVPNRLELEKLRVYWLANTDKAAELGGKLGAERFMEGFLVGPYAAILKEASRRRMNNLIVLSESFPDFPDPEAAAQVLQALSKIVGKEINVKALLEEAELIRIKTRELMKNTRRALAQMQKGYEQQIPLMYT
jgi:uncharacterized protein